MVRTTRVLQVDAANPDPRAIAEAAAILRAGGLVAFPTETVYGLGADATNPQAVASIYQAKGRPSNNPLIVHGDDVAAVRSLVRSWPIPAARLAARFWPGPLTMVLPRTSIVPDVVTGGGGTVGVRVPDSEVARRLIRETGRPIAAPSANRSTGVSPTRAEHVLKDLDGRIALILDAGPTSAGMESTVIDLTAEPPRLLRPGVITTRQISNALGVEVEVGGHASDEGALTSPGQMELHYSPRALVMPCDPSQIMRDHDTYPFLSALIVAGHQVPAITGAYDERVDWFDPETAARELYATLHRWDERKIHRIDVVLPPDDDAWRAVRDRLWRASRRWAREGQD